MGRYLCQLCWSIVQYGERHPCFFHKGEEEVYTVPPPNKPEETEGKEKKETEETPTGKLNDSNWSPFAAAEQNCIERSNEKTSLQIENRQQISVKSASRRKRSRLSLMPSKFLPGAKTGPSDSKSDSSTNRERDGSKDAEKNYRKNESASAMIPLIGKYSSSELATSSVELGSVAGPSGTQTQSHRTQKATPFECEVCGKAFSGRYNLEMHKNGHTGDRPFVCGTCDRGFTTQSNLNRHLLTHTKPFECEFCGKRVARKDQLVVHLLTHTGEKPHKRK